MRLNWEKMNKNRKAKSFERRYWDRRDEEDSSNEEDIIWPEEQEKTFGNIEVVDEDGHVMTLAELKARLLQDRDIILARVKKEIKNSLERNQAI